MRASSTFNFEDGISTRECLAREALRTRVSKSAIGSVFILPRLCFSLRYFPSSIELESYQLALVTPGISPFSAKPRKQMRHISNLRRNARGRPQILQRLRQRTLNFGVFFCLANCAVRPISLNSPYAGSLALRRAAALPAASAARVLLHRCVR